MPQKKIRLIACQYNIIGTSGSNIKRIRAAGDRHAVKKQVETSRAAN